jgi:hypothetical protein
MSVKIKARHRRFCRALFEESIGKPTPCWVTIDKPAQRLGLSYEAAFMIAYDCEKAGLARYDRSETMKALEAPHSVCLTDEGWRLMRKPRQSGPQPPPEPRRRSST